MTSRLGSNCTSCAIQNSAEMTTCDNVDEQTTEQVPQPSGQVDSEPGTQSGMLWRISSGALGGVYNAASGVAGVGYNSTKWVLGKGLEIGSTVAVKSKDVSGGLVTKTAEVGSNIVNIMPVPSKFKAKDKKE